MLFQSTSWGPSPDKCRIIENPGYRDICQGHAPVTSGIVQSETLTLSVAKHLIKERELNSILAEHWVDVM